MNMRFRVKPTVPLCSVTRLFPDSPVWKTSNDGDLRSSREQKTASVLKLIFCKKGLRQDRSQEGRQGGRGEGEKAVAEVLELLLTKDIACS